MRSEETSEHHARHLSWPRAAALIQKEPESETSHWSRISPPCQIHKNHYHRFFFIQWMNVYQNWKKKKMQGKIGVSSVSWAPPSVRPEFYKRGYSAVLKTASTADSIKTFMPLADLKTKMDQEGNIAKLSAVTQVLEIMTWLYKRSTNKTKISDAFVYAAYTHSIWYISLMHAMNCTSVITGQ